MLRPNTNCAIEPNASDRKINVPNNSAKKSLTKMFLIIKQFAMILILLLKNIDKC